MKLKFINILNEMNDMSFTNSKNIVITNDISDNIIIKCELAISPKEYTTGVIGRDGLDNNCGILFKVKPNSKFHMKGVTFPLDMIFISKDGNIIDIIQAEPEMDNIFPPSGSYYNLEMNKDFCKLNNIGKGCKISNYKY